MASLDLSMAFYLVNTELLVKRIKLLGMPKDLIELIREWLTGRFFNVLLKELLNLLHFLKLLKLLNKSKLLCLNFYKYKKFQMLTL